MIRNLPRGKSGNQMVNFLMREFLPFAFLFDESWDVHENVRYAPGFVSVARGARLHISYFNALDSDRFAANGLSKLRKAPAETPLRFSLPTARRISNGTQDCESPQKRKW
jgi:hypothetical protein